MCVLARVCPCEHIGVVYVGILKCVFISICDAIARHSLSFDPVWKVPAARPAGSVFPPSDCQIHSQTWSDLYLCPEFFRMEPFSPKRPFGFSPVYYFVIVIVRNPSGKKNLEETFSFLIEDCLR